MVSQPSKRERWIRDHPFAPHAPLAPASVGRGNTSAEFSVLRLRRRMFYCFSQTVIFVKGLPSAGLVPLAKMFRTFPSFETEKVAVSACLPSLVKFASILLGLIRFTETVWAPLGIAPIVG